MDCNRRDVVHFGPCVLNCNMSGEAAFVCRRIFSPGQESRGILSGEGCIMRNKMARCPVIVLESLQKLKEIQAENNYEFGKPTRSS
jgi:hypothetical protein